MRLIDIDQIKIIENVIHYIKEYKGSAVLMDKTAKIHRKDIKFSIEYKPVGDPDIKVLFFDESSDYLDMLLPKMQNKISQLDKNGVLAGLHREN